MENKNIYEEVKVEMLCLSDQDVVATSAFDGEDDNIEDWTKG